MHTHHANPSRVTCPNADTLVVYDQIKLTIHGYIHSSPRSRKQSVSPTGSPFTQSTSFDTNHPAGGRSLDVPRHLTTRDSGSSAGGALLPVRVTTPGQRPELVLLHPHSHPSAQHVQGPVAPAHGGDRSSSGAGASAAGNHQQTKMFFLFRRSNRLRDFCLCFFCCTIRELTLLSCIVTQRWQCFTTPCQPLRHTLPWVQTVIAPSQKPTGKMVSSSVTDRGERTALRLLPLVLPSLMGAIVAPAARAHLQQQAVFHSVPPPSAPFLPPLHGAVFCFAGSRCLVLPRKKQFLF